jgi:hypothetical protein
MAIDFNGLKGLNQAHKQLGIERAKQTYESEIRDNLKTGDLIFFSGKHWLSDLIRWRSKSGFSHVGLVVRLPEIDKVFLIESIISHGVRLIPFSGIYGDYFGDKKDYGGRVIWARHNELSEIQAKELRDFALELLTRQYDSKEYIRGFWRMIVGRIRIYPDRKLTCSELVFECFKKVGIKLDYEKGNLISPGVIYRNKGIDFMGVMI